MHREQLCRIGPDGAGRIARLARQLLKIRNRIFVRILGMDRLAILESETLASDIDRLRPAADEMHLHAAALAAPARPMPELIEFEGSAEFAIDPAQQIEIEGGGDARRIVIGALEDRRVLAQIDADDHRGTCPEKPPRAFEKVARFVAGEIADGRAREE